MTRKRLLSLAVAAILSSGCAGGNQGDFSEVGAPDGGSQTGIASYYAERYHGRTTASGETFDMHALTAAHRSLPFGTKVRVTNLDNGRKVVLRINDRGPFVEGRIIDVSWRAAGELGFRQQGLAKVRVEVLG